jgi:hypothetical protein
MLRLFRRIGRLVSHPNKLRDSLRVFWDYLVFRKRYPFLSRGGERVDPSRKALIVSLTDWIAQVKMEALLAKALQIRGCTPIVLTSRANRWAQLYFQACGIEQFLFLDDLVKEGRSSIDPRLIEEALAGELSFQRLCAFSSGGRRTGRHVLSTVVRRLKAGSLEIGSPKVRQLLREAFGTSLEVSAAARLLFERLQPEVVLFLEKGYSPYGEIFEEALRLTLNTVQFVHAQRPDALILKRYYRDNADVHPFSLAKTTWSRVRAMPWSAQQEEEILHEIRQGYERGMWFNRRVLLGEQEFKEPAHLRRELGLDPRKKTAVIFSHVLWDATFFYGESLFPDYEQWLVETVKVACENTSVNWVIKLHPDYVWKMKREGEQAAPRDIVALEAGIGELPSHITVVPPHSPISPYSFFQLADVCITVRGTVGIEASCFGVPVLTAGTGRYAGLGFTEDSRTPEEYLGKLRRIQDLPRLSPERTSLARRHAYALFHLRPLPFVTFEQVQAPLWKLGHVLDHNVVIRANSFQDLLQAQDLQDFARWVLQSEEEDYLGLR